MVYVACDICGDPAGGGDDMADDAFQARRNARALGFQRKTAGGPRAGHHVLDICPKCSREDSP